MKSKRNQERRWLATLVHRLRAKAKRNRLLGEIFGDNHGLTGDAADEILRPPKKHRKRWRHEKE